MRKPFRLIFLGIIFVLAVVFFRPVSHLVGVWYYDQPNPLPAPSVGFNDQSRLGSNTPAEVIVVKEGFTAAQKQLSELVQRASREKLHVSISGARHSMGGHTLYPGALVVDMRVFHGMELDEKTLTLTVGSGATWAEVIPYLDKYGFAVAVMQSNNDFTVGGSISVNCHGWQHDAPPIASTVESFRLLTANGTIVVCSRTENKELFSLSLGGYGLFGIILDVQLRVVPNAFYRAQAHRLKSRDYAQFYAELLRDRQDVGMAYGRISVAPDSFLDDAAITLLMRQTTDKSVKDTLNNVAPASLKRLVFRGSVGSDYGKNLRWRLENLVGETAGEMLSRNQIMDEPSGWFANRDPDRTEVLHEYFVSPARLADFVEKAKAIFLQRKPDLLNITVRKVEKDTDTFLRYAREDVFGLVMLFNQGLDEKSEAAMAALTQELIDAVLACGGTYYLPYRPHATIAQFQSGYPMAERFFAEKQKYDPAGVFENNFSKKYQVLHQP